MTKDHIRWGLLSTARINERLIPAIRNSGRSKIAAVASRNPEAAKACAERWNIPTVHSSYEHLLDDPDVDVVYIPLPNALHCEWVVRTAEAGKHVLCEKPLALTASEVDRIIQASEENAVVVQEAAMYRFHPQTLRVRELLRQGAIGDVRLVRGTLTFTLRRKGDIRLDPKLGGGSLWDLGVYPVSFARTMLGEEPVEVSGFQVLGESNVDLTFAGQMRFPSGALAHLSCSFAAVPYTEAELVGTKGRIYLDLPFVNRPGRTGQVTVRRSGTSEATFSDVAGGEETEVLTFERIDAYQCQVEALEAQILDKAQAELPLSESRGNVAAVTALYESARQNRIITLPEVTAKR